MSGETQHDWLRVVYGSGRDGGRSPVQGRAREIAVRQCPSELDPANAPAGEQWVRVTLVPSEPNLEWSLYLRKLDPGPGQAPPMRVWWRGEPGSWQPLGEARQCVAIGRGRARLDVALRVERHPGEGAPPPRLRFVAEAHSSEL